MINKQTKLNNMVKKWKSSSLITCGTFSSVFSVCFVLMLFSITGNAYSAECAIPLGTEEIIDLPPNLQNPPSSYCSLDCNFTNPIDMFCFNDIADPYCVATYVSTGNNCSITDPTDEIASTCWDRYSSCSTTCANGISSFACSSNDCNCADGSGITTYTPNKPSSVGATIQTVVDSVNANHDGTANIANTLSEIKGIATSSNSVLSGISNTITTGTGNIVSAIGSIAGGGNGGAGGAGGSVTVDLSPTNTKLDKIIENQEKITDYTEKTTLTDIERKLTFTQRLNAIPIVISIKSLSVSFTSGACVMPSGVLIMPVSNKIVRYDFDLVCSSINDIKGILGAMMMFLYSFISIRVLMSA